MKKIRIKLFLELLILVYLSALILGYLICDKGPLFDLKTLLLSFSLGLVFLFSIKFVQLELFAHVAMLTILFMVYVFPRIITYLFSPDIVILPFVLVGGVDTINKGLLFVVMGTVLLLVGTFFAASIFPVKIQSKTVDFPSPVKFSLGVLVFIFIITATIELFNFVWLDISPYGKLRAETANVLVQFLKATFAVDSFFFIITSIFIFEKKYKNKYWWLFVLAVFLFYFVFTAITGSRGAGIRIFFGLLAIFLVWPGNFNLRLMATFAVIVAIFGGSILTYSLATVKRLEIVYEYSQHNPVDAKLSEGMNFEQEKIKLEQLRTASGLIPSVLNRLAILDYAILIAAQPGDPANIEKYINLTYAFKSIVNTVPGTPFPEAILNTSRVVNIVYRGYSEDFVVSHGYFSEYWTIWGLAVLLFGWWAGFIALFIGGLMLQMVYSKGALYCGMFGNYYKAFFLFYVLPLAYFSMGIDHTITTLIVLFLHAVTIFLSCFCLDAIFVRCRKSLGFSGFSL